MGEDCEVVGVEDLAVAMADFGVGSREPGVLLDSCTGVSCDTIRKLLFNIAVDTVIGPISVFGTLIDPVWKANERNVALLETEFGDSS